MTRASSTDDPVDVLLTAPDPNDPGVKASLETIALVRYLAHVATTPAVRRLVAAASVHQGVFRPLVTRELRTLGERGVPALIEARATGTPDVKKWAFSLLDGMDKKLPGEAVTTKNEQVLVDVLAAYGATRDLDALGVVMVFVDSEHRAPRDAARAAVLLYGPLAMPKLKEAYSNLLNRPPPDDWDAERLAHELFAAIDRSRLQEVYKLLDDGLARARAAGDDRAALEQAVTALGRVLARTPDLDRRAEIAPIYVHYAQLIEPTDRAAARDYYGRAARLDPQGPRADQITGRLAWLDALDYHERTGLTDEAAVRRAAALDPSNDGPREALAQLDAESAARSRRLHAWSAAGGVVFAALLGAVLFVHRRRRAPQ